MTDRGCKLAAFSSAWRLSLLLLFLLSTSTARASSTPEQRQQNDFRALATALECYRVDHGSYPPDATVLVNTMGEVAAGIEAIDGEYLDFYGHPLIIKFEPRLQIRSVGQDGVDNNGHWDDLVMGKRANDGFWGRNRARALGFYLSYAIAVFALPALVFLLPIERRAKPAAYLILVAMVQSPLGLLPIPHMWGDSMNSFRVLFTIFFCTYILAVIVSLWCIPWRWPWDVVAALGLSFPPAMACSLFGLVPWSLATLACGVVLMKSAFYFRRLRLLGYDWVTMEDARRLARRLACPLADMPACADIAATPTYTPTVEGLVAVSKLRKENCGGDSP